MSSNNNNNNNVSEEQRLEQERQAYNDYILRDGIHEKIQAQIDKKIQSILLDKVYERTRRRIREKGGMIKHDDAMKWVIATQSKQILEELYNLAVDGVAEDYPLIAENLRLDKDEKTREQAMRVYDEMMKKFE